LRPSHLLCTRPQCPGPPPRPRPTPNPQAKAPWGGYLLFARAVLGGAARLAPVPSASAGPDCMNVKLWPLAVARKGPNGEDVQELRVVALNKQPAGGSCRVSLRVEPPPGARYGAGSLQWLLPGDADPAGVAGLEKAAGCGGRGCGAAVGGGLGSTAGSVTLGGQAMDAEGRLQPAAPRVFTVAAAPASGGAVEYAFTLPGSSGALLTVPDGRPMA
jgi:hypothetical protein